MLVSACHIVAGELVEASLDAALNPAPSSPSLKACSWNLYARTGRINMLCHTMAKATLCGSYITGRQLGAPAYPKPVPVSGTMLGLPCSRRQELVRLSQQGISVGTCQATWHCQARW